jgi:hypothetical protein
MITVKDIKVRIDKDINGQTLGVAPYTFVFTSNNTCTSFSSPTGTCALIDGYYTALTNVIFTTENCISNSIISCQITDANGCTQVKSPVIVNNPCTITNTLSVSGEYIFVASTSGGSGNYTYSWQYNNNIFEPFQDLSPTDNYLSLKLKPNAFITGSTTTIHCTVTDSNNCTKYSSYSYTFCQPTAFSVNRLALNCDTTVLSGCSGVVSQYKNYSLGEHVQACSGQTIDWSTLEFSLPSSICFINNNNGTINVGSTSTSEAVKIGSFRVKTTSGIPSNWANITVSVPPCNVSTFFGGVPTTSQIVSTSVVSDVLKIPVEPRVSSGANWSTFTFNNIPAFGTVTFNANREIEYVITDLATTPNIPDVIKWSVNDNTGKQINITDTLLRDAIPAPITTTDTVCASCGGVTGPIDVLANDTGDIDRSTLTITLNDPQIVITKDSDNNLTFTALPGASFSNLNKYKVANTQGTFSAEQGFMVQAACVGSNPTPTKNVTCDLVKSFNIYDQFSGVNAFNLSFAETGAGTPYTTAGGTITGGLGTLNFTSIPNGTYTFQMTAQNVVACSPTYNDIGTLTVIHEATPSITISGYTNPTPGLFTVNFTYNGLATPVFTVLDNGVAASFQTTVQAVNGLGTFTVYSTTGHTISISVLSQCGTTITVTQVL